MRALLAIVSGFVVSLGMFAAGLAAAVYLLAVEPRGNPGSSLDVAELWTAEPRRIDKAAQHLERVPASSAAPALSEPRIAAPSTAPAADPETVDAATTASIQTAAASDGREDRLLPPDDGSRQLEEIQEQLQPAADGELSAAHLEWCAARYRSYRPTDNSYTSYSGGVQPCISPYSGDAAEANNEAGLGPAPVDRAALEWVDDSGDYPALVQDLAPVQYAADDSAYTGSDHASYCFSRYRSYRPEDNTYQPFGGGPRQQCR